MAQTRTVLGFYQDGQSSAEAAKELGRAGLRACATIQRAESGQVIVTGTRLSPIPAGVQSGLAVACSGVLVALLALATALPRAVSVPLALAAGCALWYCASCLLNSGVPRAVIVRHLRFVTPNETLVIAQVPAAAVAHALEILRGVQGESPITFSLASVHPLDRGRLADAASAPPLSSAGLREAATQLAPALQALGRGAVRRQPLSGRLRDSERVLSRVHGALADAARLEKPLTMSAEWLLDNAYILQGHIAEFRRCLPRGFYETLPVIGSGPLVGLPRTYAIASELVADTDGRLDEETIHAFVDAYQSDAPLKIGELWALPLMLRLALIEHVKRLAELVDRRERERELADFWANRILYMARRDPEGLAPLMSELAHRHPDPTSHFGEQLVGYLRDEETALAPTRSWLESALGLPLLVAFQQENVNETAQQVALANAIGSLRLFTHLRWQDTFERLSAVEAILRTDPAGVYPLMDFATRDRYRRVVETIARSSSVLETDVALRAIALAQRETGDPTGHVGYYLHDKGKYALEAATGCRLGARERLRRWVRHHCAAVYLGGVSAATLTAVLVLVSSVARGGAPPAALLLIGALSLLPASELAVQVTNYLGMRFMPPHFLPRMSFEAGIPDDCRTLVVVPMMLLTPDSIHEETEHLRTRFLANSDSNLLFGLLSDYSDAPLKEMPEDVERLDVVEQAISRLDSEFGPGRFFLFHRQRRWSEGEGSWIGWERKRGKLEHLNRFLTGDPEFDGLLRVGDAAALQGVRFVITLDADTQLPRDAARRLVETLAHPLNRPHVSADGRTVERGYGIIQPRVSTSLPSATATRFSRIYADTTGVDPYTQAISDIFQDISGEGSYHGKGIYDLATFHSVLGTRLPENTVLSHDLLEGAHVRVALATDIELLDRFPQDYVAYSSRQHRWTRGDWQILDWALPRVPSGGGGHVPNPLAALSRWKIADNLRRSLVPVMSLALLWAGWWQSHAGAQVSEFVGAMLLLPSLSPIIQRLSARSARQPTAWREVGTSLMRAGITAALIPQQCGSALDAILRSLHRRVISHRHLLEWQTAHSAHRKSRDQRGAFVVRMLWVPLATLVAANVVAIGASGSIVPAAPFLLLWVLSPALIAWLNADLRIQRSAALSGSDRRMLRQVARQTWRFFADFVGPDTNWLPPDNYQDDLRVEVAERTSPTNIGLGLLVSLAAHDLGYISLDAVMSRTRATLDTLERLERFEGHLYNWYDVRTLTPLNPRYVSMVDSGNLLGNLWALDQGLDELLSAPAVSPRALDGLSDTLGIVRRIGFGTMPPGAQARGAAAELRELAEAPLQGAGALMLRLRAAATPAAELVRDVRVRCATDASALYWAGQLGAEVSAWNEVLDRYLGWMDVLAAPPLGGLTGFGPDAHAWRRLALADVPSLRTLAAGDVPGLSSLVALGQRRDQLDLREEARDWLDRLTQSAYMAQASARDRIAEADDAMGRIRSLAAEMNMRFVYDAERRLFFTGYNVSELRMDVGHYDLLASEARLGSFVAVARGEVPVEHWWSLGRPFGSAYGRSDLLSWNGSMFEYLMPLLLTRSFDHSLLDKACRDAVAGQIAYGKKRHVPWGVSEAAFSALDSRQTYQYRSFGVPGLGIKRGLQDDLVVAPYATALALGVDARAAVKNLRALSGLSALPMRGNYGYYESLDYTRRQRPGGERGVVVRTYMAHHQGMILAAIDNALNDEIMQERFHRDPRVRATESLLYERIPALPGLADGDSPDEPLPRLAALSAAPRSIRIDTAATLTPRTNTLSNGSYSVMVTNAGGGYSRWRELALTRWRADTTRDAYGSFCYLKDQDTGAVWSSSHHPVCSPPDRYSVVFLGDKTEFRRTDAGIETLTEIAVSPEDDVEVRLITLTNRSLRQRRIELTSYVELALAPHTADRAHPAFSKMFVQTEALAENHGLLAWRRPRSVEDLPVWALHVVASEQGQPDDTQYETDRAGFIGRGHTLAAPAALGAALAGATGAVLDPVFSLRRGVVIGAGQRVEIAFVTGAADSRDQAALLVEKYSDLSAVHRALTMAWTHAELEDRHLGIHQDEAQRFQQLAAHVMYPNALLRPAAERLALNVLGPPGLWPYGISGDLPIVLVQIGDSQDLQVVREVLLAHSYWRSKGLKVDVVLLAEPEEGTTYEQPLLEALGRIMDVQTEPLGPEQPGRVFLVPGHKIPAEHRVLLTSMARAVLVAARGPLSQQLSSPRRAPLLPAAVTAPATMVDLPSSLLPFMELKHFNGVGGFTEDGKEYAIYLGPGVVTPMPWVNVIANPSFGALVSECGAGPTWYGNSQSNRLTPWSNDPICDPVADAIYIRDDALDVSWTPTPSPIRENDAYRVRHGQGYSVFEHHSHAIEQEVTVLVPMDEDGGAPLRIQRLHVRNATADPRRLTITLYCEWVLGVDREDTQMAVVTEWDAAHQVLMARNPGHPDYGGRVAFVATNLGVRSFTGDRTEFLGRNGSASAPAALRRVGLSGRVGAGLDPCAALQVVVDLLPNQETDAIFLLGQAESADEARALVQRHRDPAAFGETLAATKQWWDGFLETVQVETPDPAADPMLNRWLLYQALSCRLWGRTAFYQSGGAYGFRDQLQDAMGLVHAAPWISRAQIVRAASRQFVEGDVQHWWHPASGAGVRTRISDDPLWLPYVTAYYVRTTGDQAILDEVVPFLAGHVLERDEHEAYYVPVDSTEVGSIMEHCRRAIARGTTAGPQGLPLIGGGDWSDGLNRVGIEGKGESVWLAWFLVNALNEFAGLLDLGGSSTEASECRARAHRVAEAVEAHAWDGGWYLRATFDDGTPIGSARNTEAQIDSMAQSWAVISGAANPVRAAAAMRAVEWRLVRPDDRMVLLFAPPFENTPHDPGYIKGYPPGVRENGGQYTHGSLWVPMALARLGDGDKAAAVLGLMNPVTHATDLASVERYMVEPYVAAADVYALEGHVGRGGWTWYTGSAALMYRVWLEDVLGFKRTGDALRIDPTIPHAWREFTIRYRHGASRYRITVENPDAVCSGVVAVTVDGEPSIGGAIPLLDDGEEHAVAVRMGTR